MASSESSSASSFNEDEVVVFKDPSIRDAINQRLERGSSEPVTRGDLANLNGLELGSVTSLEGLEGAKRLTELSITMSTLSDLDLSPVKNLPLQTLKLTKVNMGDLSILQQWQNLDTLGLNSSSFTNTAEIGKLTNLNFLDLSDTNLSSLPANLSQLTKLSSLYVHNNPISELSAINTGQLGVLGMSNTQVSSIAFLTNASNLSRLEMDGSEVSDLSVLPKGGQLTFVRANNTPVYDLTPLINRTPKLSIELNNSCAQGPINAKIRNQLGIKDYTYTDGVYGKTKKPCPNPLATVAFNSTATYTANNLTINWSVNGMAANDSLTCDIHAALEGQQATKPIASVENCQTNTQTTLSPDFIDAPISINVSSGFGQSRLFSSTLIPLATTGGYLHSYDWGQTVVTANPKLIPNKNALLRLHILSSDTTTPPDINLVASLNGIDTPLTVQKPAFWSNTKSFNSNASAYVAIIDRALMQPGLSITFTLNGTTKEITPSFGTENVLNFTLVPIKVAETTGEIPDNNLLKNALLEAYPLAKVNLQTRAVYTSTATTAANTGSILQEIKELHTIDGDNSHYYGLFSRNLSNHDTSGVAFLGEPTAIGKDDFTITNARDIHSDLSTLLHEFGHTFNLRHIACHNNGFSAPLDPDRSYPYNPSIMGSLGIDLSLTTLFLGNSMADFMSYCGPAFISDYSYQKAQTYLEAHPSLPFKTSIQGKTSASASAQKSWFISGNIAKNNSVTLRRFMALPRAAEVASWGEYQVRLTDLDNKEWVYDFNPLEMDHAPSDAAQYFSVLVPYHSIKKLEILHRDIAIFSQTDNTASTAKAQQKTSLTPSITLNNNRVCLNWNAQPNSSASLLLSTVTGSYITQFMDATRSPHCVDYQHQAGALEWKIIQRKGLQVEETTLPY